MVNHILTLSHVDPVMFWGLTVLYKERAQHLVGEASNMCQMRIMMSTFCMTN